MATESTTVNRGYDLPHKANSPAFDVDRIVAAITAIDGDVATILGALAIKAALASPAFEGTPTAPTQPVGTNNNTIATTGHVQAALSAFLNDAEGAIATITELQAALSGAGVVEDLMAQIALKAPLDSAALVGTPTAPTALVDTNTAQLATTAFVQLVRAAIVSTSPTALNTLAKLAAAIGNDANFIATVSSALAGKAPIDSPAFTGNPTVPTQAVGNNTTRAASTAFVKAAIDTALSTMGAALSNAVALLVPKTRKVNAGAGLSGGGALDADRTVSLGAAKPITNSSTGTVGAEGHDHALGFVAAEVYTGSNKDQTSFPLGHSIMVYVNAHKDRNAAITPCLGDDDGSYVISGTPGAGAALSGVWRVRGGMTGTNFNGFYKTDRVQ